ncbi:MAG TPA: hypothetical protein VNZ52_14610 [Candidatus Thermoplasmatota archaeon]|nr:hypothetical protein [Candidatus Thermoplasmatota archaeon]
MRHQRAPAAVLSALLLLLTGLGLAPAGAGAELPPAGASVPFIFTTAGLSGVAVFDLAHASGLSYHGFLEERRDGLSDSPAVGMFLVSPAGAIESLWFTGGGHVDPLEEGVVYAGGGDLSVASPAVGAADLPSGGVIQRSTGRIGLSGSVPFSEARFLIYWANLPGSVSVNLTWASGTTVTLVPVPGSAASYPMYEYGGGARAAVPLAFGLHVADTLTMEAAGGQFFGYLFWSHSQTVGRGEFRLEHNNRTGLLSLDWTPDHLGPRTCLNFRAGFWFFTSETDVAAHLEYVGEMEETQFLLALAHLPAGTLPANAFRERVLYDGTC